MSQQEALLSVRDGEGLLREVGDGTIRTSFDDGDSDESRKWSWRKFYAFVGPGWLMSLAYLDPGNLEADLQQGAYTKYSLVWVLFWATIIGLILQELSSRIAVVTGQNLAQVATTHYSTATNRFLYLMMEIAIIGSDIQEVLGSAIGINLLSNGKIDLVTGCLITGLDTFTFLFIHIKGVRYLEALVCILIGTMAICFFINWGEVDVNSGELAKGWTLPTIKSYAVMQAVGTIGAVIMPHNLYLHSGLVLSRKINRNDQGRVDEAKKYFFVEAVLALAFSFLINLAIVSTFAEYFFDEDCAKDGYCCMPDSSFVHEDDKIRRCQGFDGGNGESFSCGEIGLDTAGPALDNQLGQFGQYMWGLGLLAAGQASTMTATLAGQIVMGGFLDLKISPWVRVAITRAIALGPAVIVCYTTAGDSGLTNRINEWLNILQSVQLPFAMLPLIQLTSLKKVMGERHMLMGFHKTLCYSLAGLVLAINGYLVADYIYLDSDAPIPQTTTFNVFATVMLVIYFGSIAKIASTKGKITSFECEG